MIEKVWCQQHTSANQGENWRKACPNCCSFCDQVCSVRTCKPLSNQDARDLCAWRCTPFEWLMGKLDRRAAEETYQRRRVEHYLKEGYRPNDGTWEGRKLSTLWRKNRKLFEAILKELGICLS